MAKIKRTYHEALLQKLLPRSLSASGFQRTSNARNEVMFKEATLFSQWLLAIEKDIVAMQKTTDRFVKGTSDLMKSSLPCTYEESSPGVLTTLELERKTVGEGVNLQKLNDAPLDAKSKMASDVLQPLNNWITGYKQIKKRMSEVESLRLEVDSRRRTVKGMNTQLNRSRTRQFKTSDANPTLEEKLQRQESRVQHKSSKADTALAQYNELETDIFNQLCDLIKDTVFLKQYMAEAMLIQADCFNAAYISFSGRAPLSENRANQQYTTVTTQVTSGSETSTQVQEHTSTPLVSSQQESNPFGTSGDSNPFGTTTPQDSNPFSNEKTAETKPQSFGDSANQNPFATAY